MSAFVDISAFYAVLITTDHVLLETWRLARDRSDHATADRFWATLRAGAATIEHITPADLDAAWAIGEAFPDQEFPLVDRTSFAVMERLGVNRAIAFDDDFAVYRFGPRRDRAFEMLR